MSQDLTRQLPQNDSEKLSLVLSTMQAMAVRVDNLEQTVKISLYEQRPILHKIIADIAQLQEGQHRLEEGHRELKEGQEALRSDLLAFRKRVDYRFMILSGTVLSKYRDLEQRVTILELNSNPPNSQT